MEGKMKVAVMTGTRQMEIQEREIPKIKKDEVLVKIEYVGICGSDMHFFEVGRLGNWIVDVPLVLGHESGGTVMEVGENVVDLKPGDRVALEPGVGAVSARCARKVSIIYVRIWILWRFRMNVTEYFWNIMRIRRACALNFQIMYLPWRAP